VKKDKKNPKYQSPVVMPLGELASGKGAACNPVGTVAVGGNCQDVGGTAQGACNSNGATAAAICQSGGSPG